MRVVAGEMMQAAWIEEFGGPDVIRVGEHPRPIRKPGEVLVRMASATLNHHDIYLRRGEVGRVLPVVLGSDGAGVIVEADHECELAVGTRVAIYPVLSCGACRSCRDKLPHKCRTFGMVGGERDGTQSEYVSVPSQCVVPLPDGLNFDTAAAISLAGLTAWNMVYDEGHARAGENALVLGASGGVGMFTVALSKRLGLTVHAVTSDMRKRDALLAQGADTVLADNPGAVLRHTRGLPDGGVDIAFNSVGGATWRYVPPAVRPGGRILVCGAVRSPAAELDIRQIFYRSVALLGCSMGTPEALRHMLDAAVDDARLRAPVDSIIELDAVSESHRRIEGGAVSGKIVIHLSH